MIDQNLPVLVPVIFLLAALLAPLLGLWKRWLSYLVATAATAVSTAIALYGLYYVIANGTLHHKFGGWIPPNMASAHPETPDGDCVSFQFGNEQFFR